MDTVSPQEFTTKHQTSVSEIHSTTLIVLMFVLLNATSAGDVNFPLTTASNIWYDVINLAEWFTFYIMRMTEYSQCHIYTSKNKIVTAIDSSLES